MPNPPDHLAAEIARLKGEIARMTLEVVRLEAMREERERLLSRDRGGNTEKAMVTAERLRVSRGKRNTNPLRDALNASNFTMRSLAEQLRTEKFEVTHSLLSQAQKGKRSISERLARRVEALTGYPASKSGWPKLRTGE